MREPGHGALQPGGVGSLQEAGGGAGLRGRQGDNLIKILLCDNLILSRSYHAIILSYHQVMVVANYDPAGNFVGKYKENVPAPA